ncbi:MAG: prenyltransferase/squalene oxidase repeat-containing protein [Planctomycetota bacterium]
MPTIARKFLSVFAAGLALLLTAAMAPTTHALDAEHQAKARVAIDQGLDYLRSTQNPDGSWTPAPGPAVTGLIVAVMLDQPDLDATDPTIAKALEYILDRVQPDGSIRDSPDGILANYNTAICLSALARIDNDPEVAVVVRNAQQFLKGLQWTVGDITPDGETITPDHPYMGGAGYGNNGRPDMSNTQLLLQGLYDSGVDCDAPAFQAALTFISRCQGIESNDYFPEGTIVNDGGVIYATSVNKDNKHIPVSYANPELVDEAKAGRAVSGLRGYGSITYAAFKSFLYANLERDDPRVVAALEWIENNYTLDQNPGMPESVKHQGLYYYYMTHARALGAYGSTYLNARGQTPTAVLHVGKQATRHAFQQARIAQENKGYDVIIDLDTAIDGGPARDNAEINVALTNSIRQIDWANALIAKLVELQNDDGSFVNTEKRWMETDANLVTAYSLTALMEAAN